MMLPMDRACAIVPPIMMASMESLAERVSDPFVLKFLNVTEIDFISLRNVGNAMKFFAGKFLA